jgi:glucan phosphoethanolaminetransferase (alkaline phosphatase superfamily)
MVVLIIVALVCAVMGILVLIGKGDNLIAGYNTASKEERERYDIKRLRGLIGGLMIVLAPLLLLMIRKESMASIWSFCAIVLVLCLVVILLANTWAKKKSQ